MSCFEAKEAPHTVIQEYQSIARLVTRLRPGEAGTCHDALCSNGEGPGIVRAYHGGGGESATAHSTVSGTLEVAAVLCLHTDMTECS